MERPDNIFKWALWNPGAIASIARSIRNGMACTCDPIQKPVGGAFNWAVFFVFDNGEQWVLRSPYDKMKSGIAPALSVSLIKSEVATLKYLKKYTSIPVPTVHAFSPDASNGAGIPYILMDKAPGHPFNKVWSNGEARDKVLRQLGSYTWQLAQHRFEQIGSLFSTAEDSFALGKCLSRGHILQDRYRPGVINGPFNTAAEYWESLFAAFREQVESVGLRDPHSFMAPKLKTTDYDKNQYERAWQLREDFLAVGQKHGSADNRVDYLIATQIAQDLLSQWMHANPATTLSKPFALQHPDLSVNNIFVDNAFNITCIIDWEFCTTVPLEMLFSPPGFPQSRHEPSEWLIGKFQEAVGLAASRAYLARGGGAGPREIMMTAHLTLTSPDTPEVRDEAAIIRSADRLLDAGRFFWPLTRLINLDSTEEHKLLAALWERSPRSDGDGLSIAACFSRCRASPQSRLLWRILRRKCLAEGHAQRREDAHFYLRSPENREVDLAIARKLTVVSDWRTQYTGNPGRGIRKEGELFVADVKLWRWVLKWEEEYWGLYG